MKTLLERLLHEAKRYKIASLGIQLICQQKMFSLFWESDSRVCFLLLSCDILLSFWQTCLSQDLRRSLAFGPKVMSNVQTGHTQVLWSDGECFLSFIYFSLLVFPASCVRPFIRFYLVLSIRSLSSFSFFILFLRFPSSLRNNCFIWKCFSQNMHFHENPFYSCWWN